ncbi:MAG: hypothetical protein EZS28_023304 [Streblomastix strix]|uniref:Uncharacterized protein n=1 Tax=Streblomastix strix TaxID=222440 RepID=A0A5J4VF30_9EUKA|nr:MAG: hypothetical protein EZS28_023304 [Streblomastix strix]
MEDTIEIKKLNKLFSILHITRITNVELYEWRIITNPNETTLSPLNIDDLLLHPQFRLENDQRINNRTSSDNVKAVKAVIYLMNERNFSNFENQDGLNLTDPDLLPNCLDQCKLLLSPNRLSDILSPSQETSSRRNQSLEGETNKLGSKKRTQQHQNGISLLNLSAQSSLPSFSFIQQVSSNRELNKTKESSTARSYIFDEDNKKQFDQNKKKYQFRFPPNEVQVEDDTLSLDDMHYKSGSKESEETMKRLYPYYETGRAFKKPKNFHPIQRFKKQSYVFADPNVTYGLNRTIEEIDLEQAQCYIPNPTFISESNFPIEMPPLPEEFHSQSIMKFIKEGKSNQNSYKDESKQQIQEEPDNPGTGQRREGIYIPIVLGKKEIRRQEKAKERELFKQKLIKRHEQMK